jgi:hypothetical protein
MEKTRQERVKNVVGRELGWDREFSYVMKTEKTVVENRRARGMVVAIGSDKDQNT